jgi:hypothetical protein
MQYLKIIKNLSTLLHKHGPDSDEVRSYVEKFSHIDAFVGRAQVLQSVFREKENTTQAHS